MPVWEDVAAVEGRSDLSARQKTLEQYRLKVSSIADWINNGKPPPNPLPPVIGQTYSVDGINYTIFLAQPVERVVDGEAVATLRLVFRAIRASDGTVLISPADDHYITNPPILPSDRRQDLIAAGKEILANIVRARG